VKIVLVTRQDCHLCDEALTSLRSLGVEPELRDVDADPGLHALYDWRVPVVMLDGRVIAEGRIDRDALRKAIQTV
jgi:predicted thioredoxin/glutaredoxin